jgi:ribose/xylose/arabinose/galactoside ABC-type transport system permease subunit
MENVAVPGLTIDQRKIKIFLLDHVIELCLVALIIGLTFGANGFMTWANWMNILRANSLKGVIAFGMTMVMIAGLIDLSIGSIVGLSGVIVAVICRDLTGVGIDINVACILGMAICFVQALTIGWLHGVVQHKTGLHPFIITLVSLNVFLGLAGRLSGGFPIANQFPEWFNQLGGGRIGGQNGIPIPAVVLVASFLIVWFIMEYTTTGRAAYAVGGNPESARLSGINVAKTKIIAFIIVQFMAVVSGFMTAGQVMSGTFSFGKTWEMDVIAAVVVGGTSFSGGAGKVSGTFVGILFMAVISNGMTLLNIDIHTQYIVKAVIVFLAVLLSSYRAQLKA